MAHCGYQRCWQNALRIHEVRLIVFVYAARMEIADLSHCSGTGWIARKAFVKS